MLLQHRVIAPEELLQSPLAFPEGPVHGDVFIDDLVLLVIGTLCTPPPALMERAGRADEMYQDLGLPVKQDKSQGPSLNAEFWGAALDGKRGTLGYPLTRRASLAAATLCGLAYGLSGPELMRILGVWAFALSFKRELLSCLESAFELARKLSPRKGSKSRARSRTSCWPCASCGLSPKQTSGDPRSQVLVVVVCCALPTPRERGG